MTFWQKCEKKIVALFNNNYFVCLCLLACGSYVCVQEKFDYNWDFTNYHYYNAFAFLNNRLNYDIVPSSVNTFFNPLLDLPLYFLIQNFNHLPNVIYAIQGLWFGLLLFAFYKIVRLFFDHNNFNDIAFSLLTVLIAATGQATYYQAGSSTNEIPMAFFAVWSLYFIFKMIKFEDTQNNARFFLCGLILGIALGLKPTIVYICVASGLSLMICFKFLKKPLVFISLFALGGLVGYLLINGWWMYKMWSLYENPFFPFLNKVFNSPYFNDENYSDRRFIAEFPYNLLHPFIWNWGKYRTAEVPFYDIRGAVYYFLLLTSFVYLLFHPKKIKECYKNNRTYFFFAVFCILAYIIWLNVFSIYRYLVVIEMFGALFFVKTIFCYKSKWWVMEGIYYALAVFFCFVMVANYGACEWPGNKRNADHYVEMEKITLPPNTLLKLYNFPTAAVIPELSKNNTFRALGYYHYNARYMQGSDFSETGKFKQIKDEISSAHKGPTVIIYRDLWWGDKGEYFQKIIKKDTKGMYCRNLKNNFENTLYICVPENLKYYIEENS